MNKEEQDIIVFLEISVTTKAKKTIISKEDVKCLLNYIDKLQEEVEYLRKREEHLDRRRDKLEQKNEELEENNLSYQKELAKAWKENEVLKEKLHKKNMQIIKLNEFIGETKDEE